jgi:purine-binding chemotaxis protein CheW
MDKSKPKIKIYQLVIFKMGNGELGVDILKVQEIKSFQQIAHALQKSKSKEGGINLKCSIIPVIDLRKKFNPKHQERDERVRTMVINQRKKIIGLILDTAEKVLRISKDQIEMSSKTASDTVEEVLRGMDELERDLLIMLYLDKILSTKEIIELKKLEQINNDIKDAINTKRSKESDKVLN